MFFKNRRWQRTKSDAKGKENKKGKGRENERTKDREYERRRAKMKEGQVKERKYRVEKITNRKDWTGNGRK